LEAHWHPAVRPNHHDVIGIAVNISSDERPLDFATIKAWKSPLGTSWCSETSFYCLLNTFSINGLPQGAAVFAPMTKDPA
jgi:hypothetical protein